MCFYFPHVFLFSGKIAPNNDNFMYYYCFPMKTYFLGVFTSLYNGLLEHTSKIIKCKNLTKSALGGVP